MKTSKAPARTVAIVIGADDVGSAVAVALHRAGFASVICDDIDPPWARRGMSFTNAWYFGNAELDGETAVCCASAKSVPSLLRGEGVIAATPWSWHGMALALNPIAVVQSRSTRRREGGEIKARAPKGAVVIGIGAGYTAGVDVDVAIASGPEASADAIVAGQTTGFDAGSGLFVGAAAGIPFVRASTAGRFATNRRIGEPVRRGEVVGAIGRMDVVAPIDGVLRGLSARGAAVFEGVVVAEVDPRGDPVLCFGIDEHAWGLAQHVVGALVQRVRSAMEVSEREIIAADAHAE